MSDDILSVSAQDLYDHFGGGATQDYKAIINNAESLKPKIESRFDYIVGWHKTSHRFRETIENYGILPRESSVMPSRDANPGTENNPESRENLVYFSVMEGGIYPNADSATIGFVGGKPMQVEAYLEIDKLEADEDAIYDDNYLTSLLAHGTFAHEGAILPFNYNEGSRIKSIEIDDEVQMPRHVFEHLIGLDKNPEDDPEFRETIMEVKDSYDSQLTRSQAAWLLEYNRERQRDNETVPKSVFMLSGNSPEVEEVSDHLEQN